ncbi:MAG: response regulator, partial [Cyclobacteriaceae bacterium]
QILHNLVGNAIKFTETGYVAVSAIQEEDMLALKVTDTGTGVPEEKIDLIFKEFEQADNSNTREFVGTGLGLSITKKLVELHGGTIDVVSKIGKGSTFTLTLPITEEIPQPSGTRLEVAKVISEPSKSLKKSIGETSSNGIGEINILVVDDEPVNQTVLANFLISSRFKITPALNGEDALKALESGQKFDLVLLDIMMPKMSGFEVCQKIREKYLPNELPVIMITAKNQVSDLVQGLSTGANDYITKPFSKDEFLARVKTHLNLFKINTAYGRFVPHEFLKALGRESIMDVRLGDQVEGEVTVFFSDIRGYSTLAETMNPEENFNFLNAYLRRVGPIIKKHNGFVSQFLGDGIMALFRHSAKDALQAAIDIQREVDRYNVKRQKDKRQTIKVGIGLHTGSLMLGILGDKDRMDASVVSDTVNTASRMEGLTKHYGANIILSKSTLEHLGDTHSFNYRGLGQVQVKGKLKAVNIYEFYDGEKKEVIALKKQTQAVFETGLNCYYQKDFTHAAIAFQEVLDVIPTDKAAQLYLQRSAEFMVKGVPEDWTGVEAMSSK